ncbi:MAG TPA: hydrogenase iron-sulfur subunit [Candidatus Acidoferrales bacterium]|nr:hydrogenase iron-sulfur subunit [Candidatus Acidoferrales bacterium]
MATEFEPKIVGFLCRWCSYAGADLAGTNRLKYPSNISSIRVNCSGRIDPTLVMKALALGADGVLIAGCHPGDCHYTNGNIKTLRRFKLLQKMLDQFGIERERVRLEWISAAEGDRYAQVVRNMTEQVRSRGPLNWQRKMEVTA